MGFPFASQNKVLVGDECWVLLAGGKEGARNTTDGIYIWSYL